jgi:hypothetical protein
VSLQPGTALGPPRQPHPRGRPTTALGDMVKFHVKLAGWEPSCVNGTFPVGKAGCQPCVRCPESRSGSPERRQDRTAAPLLSQTLEGVIQSRPHVITTLRRQASAQLLRTQRLAEVRRSRQSTGGQRSVHLAAATRSARLGSSATLRRQRSSLQGAQGWDERARDPDPSLSAAANRAGCRREQVQGSLSTSWARRCPPRVLRPSRRVGSVRPRSCRRGACLCSAVLCVGGGLVHLWEPGHGGVSKPVICINDVAQDHGPTRSPVSRERTGGSLTSSRVARRRRRRGGCLATDAENGL